MYKDEWVTKHTLLENFENVSIGSLEATACHMRKVKDISHWYRSNGKKGSALVNLGYLKYIWERRRKIQFENQAMFFEIVEKINEVELTKKFAKYVNISYQNSFNFMNGELFANTYFINIGQMNISKRLIMFNNFCNELLSDRHFDNVDEKYDYYEARKMKKEML